MNTPTQAVKRDGWTVTLTLPGTAPRFFTVVHGEVWELLGTPRERDSAHAGGRMATGWERCSPRRRTRLLLPKLSTRRRKTGSCKSSSRKSLPERALQ